MAALGLEDAPARGQYLPSRLGMYGTYLIAPCVIASSACMLFRVCYRYRKANVLWCMRGGGGERQSGWWTRRRCRARFDALSDHVTLPSPALAAVAVVSLRTSVTGSERTSRRCKHKDHGPLRHCHQSARKRRARECACHTRPECLSRRYSRADWPHHGCKLQL
jgi:hypothetical protein